MGFSYAAHRALRRKSIAILITCGLAAAVGVASYATAELRPVRHFAAAGVPGLVLVWLVTVTLVRPDGRARRSRITWMRTARNLTLAINGRFRWAIAIAALVITIGGVFLAPLLPVESNPLHFFPSDSQIVRDFDTLNNQLTGMLPSQVLIGAGGGSADVVAMLSGTPGMRKVLNVTPWVGGSDRTFLCLADNDAVESLARQEPVWQTWAIEHRTTLSWHGIAPQIHRSSSSIRKLSLESVPSMAVLIGALVLTLFRTLRLAVLSAWITLVPVAMLVVLAVLCSWKLDPVSLVIGSITTGLTVDDTLHLLSTYRRRRSMQRAIIECWRPCVGSSLAAAVCFALFTLSRFGPTSQFGMLMALATLFAMLANQLLLPAVISQWRMSRRIAAQSHIHPLHPAVGDRFETSCSATSPSRSPSPRVP
jgi:predicted RND superfamily exporter protein